ncbi:MAG: ATP-grasp domain-containing protein [Janthinobacterium lividum]
MAWVEALDKQHDFDLVIPSTERSLMAFANTACSENLYRKAVIPNRETLRRATNKEDIMQLAGTLGLPVPSSVLVTDASRCSLPFGYPVAVKPVQSKVLVNEAMLDLRVQYAQSAEELSSILDALPGLPFQVQKLVRGKGVGIELLFVHGEPALHFAHERIHEWPLTGGGSCYRQSVEAPPALLDYSIRLLKELKWHGVAMVEWKVDREAGPVLMEINPRLWGSLALAIDAGIDFPKGLLLGAKGEQVQAQRKYKVPYYTRDITRDLDWQLANLRAPRNNPQLLVRPRLQSAAELLRPLVLQESWDFFDLQDLGITFRRLGAYFKQKAGVFQRKLTATLRARYFRYVTHRRLLAKISHTPKQYKQILFLCYGNICRSPLAALLAHKALPDRVVQSAGFHEKADRSSPRHMLTAAALAGIEMANHRSRTVTSDDIRQADLVFVMDWKNYDRLIKNFPDAESKATFLGLFAQAGGMEIEDPYDLRGEPVDAVVQKLALAVESLRRRLVP